MKRFKPAPSQVPQGISISLAATSRGVVQRIKLGNKLSVQKGTKSREEDASKSGSVTDGTQVEDIQQSGLLDNDDYFNVALTEDDLRARKKYVSYSSISKHAKKRTCSAVFP